MTDDENYSTIKAAYKSINTELQGIRRSVNSIDHRLFEVETTVKHIPGEVRTQVREAMVDHIMDKHTKRSNPPGPPPTTPIIIENKTDPGYRPNGSWVARVPWLQLVKFILYLIATITGVGIGTSQLVD